MSFIASNDPYYCCCSLNQMKCALVQSDSHFQMCWEFTSGEVSLKTVLLDHNVNRPEQITNRNRVSTEYRREQSLARIQITTTCFEVNCEDAVMARKLNVIRYFLFFLFHFGKELHQELITGTIPLEQFAVKCLSNNLLLL